MCNSCDKSTRSSSNCERKLTLSLIPNTCGVLAATFDGITSVIDIKPAVQCAETVTHLQWNSDKCRLEYLNETYVSSNGALGFIESIEAKTIASCIKLKDLADVADTDPDNCDLLVYKKDPDCGAGCTGIADMWQPYTPPKVEQLTYVAGFNSDGCLVKLNDPTDPDTDPLGNNISCRILVHSGNTSSWYSIPSGTIDSVVGVNSDGCLVKDTYNPIANSCTMSPTVIPINVSNGRFSLDINSVQTIGTITIPDPGCPYRLDYVYAGYADQAPHNDGGKPYHINIRIALDSPTAYIGAYADTWHGDSATDSPIYGWSDQGVAADAISLTGSHTLYVVAESDILPIFGTADNIYASAVGRIIMYRQ